MSVRVMGLWRQTKTIVSRTRLSPREVLVVRGGWWVVSCEWWVVSGELVAEWPAFCSGVYRSQVEKCHFIFKISKLKIQIFFCLCQFEWILLLKKVKFVSRTRLNTWLQSTSRYNFLSKTTRSDKWVVSLERWTGRLVAEISRHCVSLKMTIVRSRRQVSRYKENGLLFMEVRKQKSGEERKMSKALVKRFALRGGTAFVVF